MANLAFFLILGGILLVYGEFIWVGKLFCGIAGSLSVFTGLALLSRLPHTDLGLCLLSLGVVCFLIEAAFDTYWVAGLGGSAFLGYGFCRLMDVDPKVNAWFAFPFSLLFGLVTTALLRLVKQARQNKRKI